MNQPIGSAYDFLKKVRQRQSQLGLAKADNSTNRKLISAYQGATNADERQSLAEAIFISNANFILPILRGGDRMSHAELAGQAYEILIDSVLRKYDLEKQIAFTTYSKYWFANARQTRGGGLAQKPYRLPRDMMSFASTFYTEEGKLQALTGQEPTLQDVYDRLVAMRSSAIFHSAKAKKPLPFKAFCQKVGIIRSYCFSLDQPRTNDEGRVNASPSEAMDSGVATPEFTAMVKELHQRAKMIDLAIMSHWQSTLNETDYRILRLRIVDGLGLRPIGAICHRSGERVRQIVQKAFKQAFLVGVGLVAGDVASFYGILTHGAEHLHLAKRDTKPHWHQCTDSNKTCLKPLEKRRDPPHDAAEILRLLERAHTLHPI